MQRSSALLLPWSKGEGEEGEQVAYLALDCKDQQMPGLNINPSDKLMRWSKIKQAHVNGNSRKYTIWLL